MKQLMIKTILPCIFLVAGTVKATAQSFEIQQLLLDCGKLAQLKGIYNDMIKGYDVLSEGYNAVSDISKGNFNLHELFLDGLLKASPVVRQYGKVANIIDCQLQILSEYSSAYKRFKSDHNFSPDEILYFGNVYSNLLKQSLRGLSDLTNVLTDGLLRASDDERLNQIDQLNEDMEDRLSFLRYFNSNTTVLGLQRARENNDVNTIKNIYGVKK